MLAPYVRTGMTVLEPGPGMGFFTLELARLVGPSGRVVAVDIQPKMLSKLRRRAEKAGLLSRIDIRLAKPGTMEVAALAGKIDFVLAFAMVHEMPSAEHFFQEASQSMKTGAAMLFAEPAGHVRTALWESELDCAARAGLHVAERLTQKRSMAVLLRKTAGS